MSLVTARSTYRSNVRRLQKDIDAKLERTVARAARDGARRVTALSDPPVSAFAVSVSSCLTESSSGPSFTASDSLV